MSNVADLEPCKKLFELTGWADTEYAYYANSGEVQDYANHRSTMFDKPDNLSAYDTGYLLRKLTHLTNNVNLSCIYDDEKDSAPTYHAKSTKDTDYPQNYEAYTPENALCKLAIKLAKEGLL